jgi:hypothetical protein
MIRWLGRRLIWTLQYVGGWYNTRLPKKPATVYERLDRIERWIEVHHPLIPSYASPEEVKQRGYWDRNA